MCLNISGGLNKKQRKTRGKRKLLSAHRSMKRKLEESLNVSIDSETNVTAGLQQKLHDLEKYENIMSQLKEKFNTASTSYSEKLQILTLSPFGIKRTISEFNTTKHYVEQSRKLRNSSGVLGIRKMNSKGKAITNEVKAVIRNFYENDEYSRITTSKKEVKSVRNEVTGEKEFKQKRLVLCNLRELYAHFKEESPDTSVGFSTFASLRPEWCILAGPKGTHTVCVCTYHQNTQLMISSLPGCKLTLKDVMALTVCDTQSEACMMRKCEQCPGVRGVIIDEKLNELLEFENDIHYRQWISTDRSQLVSVTDNIQDYLEKLGMKTHQLTQHHFTAKAQSQHLNHLKSTITEHEAVVLLDFSENYSFVVQDAVQGHHWNNSQATVHPFVIYHRSEVDGSPQHWSTCVISNCLSHSTSAVYCFQTKVIPLLKERIPRLEKIYYFSDGCAGQYKNRYNFANIGYHKQDFDLNCEWHFFATSHGKSPCDGVGGAVKIKTARTSLQRPVTEQILTAQDMFNFCKDSFSNVSFVFASTADVDSAVQFLKERFASAKAVKGTQQIHRVVPISNTQLKMYKLSNSDKYQMVSLS